MLSFDTDFDLIHDLTPLFRDVIAEEVVALQASPTKAPLHRPLDRGLTIVGVEKAYLLLAFDGYNKEKQTTATWIGLYDLRTALHRIVYKHYTLIHVVNASLCDGGNMLACTYSTIEPNIHSSREERYITCLIELSQHCRVYHLYSSNGSFQRAQFLHTDPAKPPSPTSSATTSSTSSASHSSPASTVKHSLLLFVHPDRIDLYTFVTGEKQGQWRILEQPKKGNPLVRGFLWAQWSVQNRTLYYLTVQDKDLYVLHARRFGSNPIDPSQVTTHNRKGVALPGNSLESVGNDTPKRAYDFTRCLRVVSEAHFDAEIVRIPQGDDITHGRTALCLIRQTANPVAREVWLAGLAFDEEDVRREAREVRVQVPWGGEGEGRAVLGRLAGMLFVYLPGSSFMLVDCMDSNRTLIAHVEDIKSTNPNGKPPHAATLLLVGDYQLPLDGVCLLDTTTRIAHRARLSRDPAAVLATAARNDPGGLACLLRVWARYMLGEEEVMTEIIRKVCTRATSLEYADVWKEYLIGMGYRAVVSSCTDPDILAQLPFSIRKRKQALRDIKKDPPLSPGFRPDPVVSTSTTVTERSSLNPSLNGRPSHHRTNSQSGLSVSVSVTQVSAQGEFQRTLSRSGSDNPSSPARNKPVSLPAKVPSFPSTSSWRPMPIPSFPSLIPSVSHSTPLSWRSSTATPPSPSTTQESTYKEEAYPRSPTIASGSSYIKTDMRRTLAEIEVGRGRGISQLTLNARRPSPPRRRTTLQGPFPSVESLAKHNVEELTIRQRLMDILVENVADYIMARRGFTESQTVRAKAIEAVGAFVRGQIQQSNHLWTTMDETRHILRFSDFATCRCWNCGVLQHRHRRHGSTTTLTSLLTHISPSSFSESPRKTDIALAPTIRAVIPVMTPMARQDSDEGMFYFEPSDMCEDADGTEHEVGGAPRRVGRVAVVFPVVSPEPEPERRAESLVLQQAAAREDRASEVAISREHVHAYKLLEGMYRALHELGLPFPEGFHTAFAVAGFHTMTRRRFLQFVQQGVFRMTDAFMQHVIETFEGSFDKEDVQFKMALVAEVQDMNKILRLQKQMPEYAPLVTEEKLATFFDSVPASTYQSADPDNASFTLIDLLNPPPSPGLDEKPTPRSVADNRDEFLPFAAFCQSLKVKGYEDVAGVRNAVVVGGGSLVRLG